MNTILAHFSLRSKSGAIDVRGFGRAIQSGCGLSKRACESFINDGPSLLGLPKLGYSRRCEFISARAFVVLGLDASMASVSAE